MNEMRFWKAEPKAAGSIVEVCGYEVQVDISGVGQCWRDATSDDCPANIVEEIAAEILDGGVEETDGYIASNGMRYRW